MRVEISRELLERILILAADDAEEVCGLLLGSLLAAAARIDDIRPAANVAADPARHFELDPAVLLAAHRAARDWAARDRTARGRAANGGGRQVIGHYHSHPSGIAVPSATDAACAAPDGGLWLIVAGGLARLWIAGPGDAGGVVFREARLDIR